MKGLKVTVTHRTTSQKFKIAGLTDENTRDISFDVDQISDRKIRLVDYFREKYNKNITQTYHVPMEFCCIDEGQRFAKEHLNKYQSDKLRNISSATPKCRESTIYDIIVAKSRAIMDCSIKG